MSLRKFLRRFSSERHLKKADGSRDTKAEVPAQPNVKGIAASTGNGSVAVSQDTQGRAPPAADGNKGLPSDVTSGAVETLDPDEQARRQREVSGGLTARDAAKIDAGPQSSKVEDRLDSAADQLEDAQKKIQQSTMVVVGKEVAPIVKAALEATGGTEFLEAGVHALEEGMPIFMKALDAAKAVHPFIGVVVLAFQAVYSLEMTRRENDKKIIALFVKMKSMMAVLIDLKDLRDVDKTAPDGTTIRGRVVMLCEKTASDVKMCSNTCDTYRHKKLIVKVLQGPIWDQRLAAFVAAFTTRRSEFQFALSIHTAQGIAHANATLSNVEKVAEEANERTKLILAAFEKLMSPQERELKKLANEQGKDLETIQQDDGALLALLNSSPEGAKLDDAKGRALAVNDIRQDLSESIEESLKKNLEVFSGKFELQQRQIQQDIERISKREGDRVIAAVNAGPFERILDQDLHDIWKDMGWKGNVKTRHFILALREYFTEKKKNRYNDVGNVTSRTALALVTVEEDDWALKYLELAYLQGIQEAFDNDASGFITISEVNRFTQSRPVGWSIVRWMAYWACGFLNTMWMHSERIEEIFHEMFSLLPVLRLENQAQAAAYLDHVWQSVATVTDSLRNSFDLPESLPEKFASYETSEMLRIKQNLEDIRYDIDEMATLTLLLGHDRVEKNFFPLTRLLLERHLQIFHLARTHVLNPEELVDAYGTMSFLNEAVKLRYEDLKELFSHQLMTLDERFKIYAFGFFDGLNRPQRLWSLKGVRDRYVDDPPYDANAQPENPDSKNILNHDLANPILLDLTGYESSNALQEPVLPPNADLPPEFLAMLGSWNCLGYHWKESEKATEPIFILTFMCADDETGLSFTAAGTEYTGEEYHISGQAIITDGGALDVTWSTIYSGATPEKRSTGRYDPGNETIYGSWKFAEEGYYTDGCFFYSRVPCEVLIYRPALWAIPAENKARALWKFACKAVLRGVRKQRWSWNYFRERRVIRTTFMTLYVKSDIFKRTYAANEREDQLESQSQIMPADARYYFSRMRQIDRLRIHGELHCAVCNGTIGFERIICLDCKFMEGELHKTLNFCDNPECTATEINFLTVLDLSQDHLPSHNYLKIRKPMTLRHAGLIYFNATVAIPKGRDAFQGIDPFGLPGYSPFDEEKEPISQLESPAAANTLPDDLVLVTGPQVGLPSTDTTPDVESLTKAVFDRNHVSGAPRPKTPTTQWNMNASNEVVTTSHVTCMACQRPLASSWWYCVDCTYVSHVFLCAGCDPMGGYQPTDSSHFHQKTHYLVTCKGKNEDTDDAEPKSVSDIVAMKEEIQALANRLANVETLMAKLLDQQQDAPRS